MLFTKIRHSITNQAETDDSYFISISDLMASLIFIFIITIVVLIINYQSAIIAHADKRSEILDSLQKDFEAEGIPVTVDYTEGSMSLPEKILFNLGSPKLNNRGIKSVEVLAEKLMDYVLKYQDSLDAVFIEGHSDNSRWKRHSLEQSEMRNLKLSVERAIETYRVLKLKSPTLCELQNNNGQRIVNVSGYGQYRPVNDHERPQADPENRRIEIRFVMTAAEKLLVKQNREDTNIRN